jgi:hypothetical protein
MNKRELTQQLVGVLKTSELDVDTQIRALNDARATLRRPPVPRKWAGPLEKPGGKKKKETP